VRQTGVSAIHFSGTSSQAIDTESRFSTVISKVDERLIREMLAVVL
jgi:hypothetical protein